MAEEEPEIWGTDQERFQAIERQLERATHLLQDLTETVGLLVRTWSQAMNHDAAVHGAALDAAEEEKRRPNDINERRQAFETLCNRWAQDLGIYNERRGVFDLVELSHVIEINQAQLMKIWNETPLETRIPGTWFDAVEAAIGDLPE